MHQKTIQLIQKLDDVRNELMTKRELIVMRLSEEDNNFKLSPSEMESLNTSYENIATLGIHEARQKMFGLKLGIVDDALKSTMETMRLVAMTDEFYND